MNKAPLLILMPWHESRAKYAEWVKKNKGRVSKDASKTIPKVLKP